MPPFNLFPYSLLRTNKMMHTALTANAAALEPQVPTFMGFLTTPSKSRGRAVAKGFGVSGFYGFRVWRLGFRDLGFRALGFRVLAFTSTHAMRLGHSRSLLYGGHAGF